MGLLPKGLTKKAAAPHGGAERAYGAIDTRQSRFTRYVTSEDEFRRVMSVIASRGGTAEAPGSGFGATVVLAKPFVVSAPLVIPVECIGVTVTASAKFPIVASGVVPALFDVRAALVTIRGVLAYAKTSADMFSTFVRVPSGAVDVNYLRVLDNDAFCDRLFVDVAGEASAPSIVGNTHRGMSATFAAPIAVLTNDALIEGNTLADGGGDAITIGSGSTYGRARIVGNDCSGADITTSGGAGSNILAANTRVGTKSLHATDRDDDASASAWTLVKKTADETITSDAALSNDAALTFAMAANKAYAVRVVVGFSTTAGADFACGVTGPSSPTAVALFCQSMIAGGTGTVTQAAGSYAGSQMFPQSGVDGSGYAIFEGVVQNGGTAGTFALQWAQRNSDASNTTVLKGSTLEYIEVG